MQISQVILAALLEMVQQAALSSWNRRIVVLVVFSDLNLTTVTAEQKMQHRLLKVPAVTSASVGSALCSAEMQSSLRFIS